VTDAIRPLPPFEEPQPPPPPKRWFLFVCDVENPSGVLSTWASQGNLGHIHAPTLRRAAPEDLERMGFARFGLAAEAHVRIPLHDAGAQKRALYASCPVCHRLFVNAGGEGVFCHGSNDKRHEREFCETRFGVVVLEGTPL
jgi:hypothetical protein